LWENFVLFEPSGWVPALLELAGLQDLVEAVVDVNWGYEIHGISQKKYADVAVHVRDAEGDAVVLVEAKRRGGKLKRDDRHPGSYLDLEAFSWTDRRALIYLVDKRDRAGVVKQVVDPGGRSGIVTWQALGGLQVRLTRSLRADSQIQDFIAGAIQYQYLQHEIVPDSLAFDYLAEELTREEIRADSRIKQTASDVLQQEWRLGGRDPKCR
jgi:hypothetical protein